MVQQKTDLKRGKIDKNEKGTEKQDYSYGKFLTRNEKVFIAFYKKASLMIFKVFNLFLG